MVNGRCRNFLKVFIVLVVIQGNYGNDGLDHGNETEHGSEFQIRLGAKSGLGQKSGSVSGTQKGVAVKCRTGQDKSCDSNIRKSIAGPSGVVNRKGAVTARGTKCVAPRRKRPSKSQAPITSTNKKMKPQVYQACVQGTKPERTLYTMHEFGSIINQKPIPRRSYFSEGEINEIGLAEAFTLQSQQAVVRAIFNNDTAAMEAYPAFMKRSTMLQRGHLVPSGDFRTVEDQHATYFYVNVVPMWAKINNGNWKLIEETVRKYATVTGRIIHIWTGGLGVFELKDTEGNSRGEFYLGTRRRKQVPVPRLLVKSVYDEKENAGIVFVTVHDPYTPITDHPALNNCVDVCLEAGLNVERFKNYERGYTYCCTPSSFWQSFPHYTKSDEIIRFVIKD